MGVVIRVKSEPLRRSSQIAPPLKAAAERGSMTDMKIERAIMTAGEITCRDCRRYAVLELLDHSM